MNAKTNEMTITIQIGGQGLAGEQEVVVEYTYTPGTPDVMYLKNGDPGYPGDPPEVEILSMFAVLKISPTSSGQWKVPDWFSNAASEYVENYIFENHAIENPEPEQEWERDVEDMHKGDQA